MSMFSFSLFFFSLFMLISNFRIRGKNGKQTLYLDRMMIRDVEDKSQRELERQREAEKIHDQRREYSMSIANEVFNGDD